MRDAMEKEATATRRSADGYDPMATAIGPRHVIGMIAFGIMVVFALWLLRPHTGLNDPLLPSSSSESRSE